MRARGCLGRLAILLGLAVPVPAVLFALHCHRVMNAPVIADMKRGSVAYACIGPVLHPGRPRFRPESWLARQYLQASGTRGLTPGWHFSFAFATWAVEVSTSAEEANRMYAATPLGRFRNFDHAARVLAGRRYCELDAQRREAVLQHSYAPSRYPIRPHRDAEPAPASSPDAAGRRRPGS